MIPAILALLGVALMLLAVGIANSTRPGTRKRWLRAAIAAPLAALGLFLALKPAAAGELIASPVLVQARHPGGALIQLHGPGGPCVSGANLATYTAPNGVDKVQGCYKVSHDAGTVGIAWFDGDGSTIPLKVFKPVDGV